MTPTIQGLLVGFFLFAGIFWLIERVSPGVKGQQKLRRGFRTDTLYWFFSPLVTGVLSRIVIALMLAPMLYMAGRSLERSEVLAGWGPVADLPVAAQALLIVVVGDFIGYWAHRLFHRRRLWPFHAVHHSSNDLDWLSSVRVHPVNDVLGKAMRAVPLVLLGFSPLVVAAYVPFLTLHAILLHSNVSWTFGPLRYVISSPAFHRWHHSCEEEAIGKNFSGLLPLWDLLFGTFYMPQEVRPTVFGIAGDPVPEGFVGQLAYPFTAERRTL